MQSRPASAASSPSVGRCLRPSVYGQPSIPGGLGQERLPVDRSLWAKRRLRIVIPDASPQVEQVLALMGVSGPQRGKDEQRVSAAIGTGDWAASAGGEHRDLSRRQAAGGVPVHLELVGHLLAKEVRATVVVAKV